MIEIARERIDRLHSISIKENSSSREDARRHLEIMENIAMRSDLTLPASIKRSYCKECKTPYGADTRIRIKRGKILLITCGHCGNRRRYSYY